MYIEIKLLNKTARLPEKMTEHAAGYDIYANIPEDITLHPLQRVIVPTGFALAIPQQYEAQIRSRSGLAIKHGIVVLNSPGTIDADYRGEVKIILINLSENAFVIKNEMRIAQMIVSKHENIEFRLVENLDITSRGEDGFGSTESSTYSPKGQYG